MLVANKNVGDIFIFLANGTEFVGKIKALDGKYVTIDQPLQITLVRGSDGKPAKALMPMSMLNPEGSFIFNGDLILGECEASKEVADAWTTETSGLVLATGGAGVLRA